MTDDLPQEARQILNVLTSIPFEQCQLNRNFASIPQRPGIYAVRHRTEGLLYIGKQRVYEAASVAAIKPFCGHGSIDIPIEMSESPCMFSHLGKTLRYY